MSATKDTGRGGVLRCCGVRCAVCGERDDLKLAQLHWNSRTHAQPQLQYTCSQNNLYVCIRHPRHPFTYYTDSSIRARVRFNLG